MEIEFLGVGEAFDPQLGNSSFLLRSQNGCLMVDCGYEIFRSFVEKNHPIDTVDGIYVTHFHADHWFGIPLLLNYFAKEKRTKELTLIGQYGLKERLMQLFEFAYPGLYNQLNYPLQFIENEEQVNFQGWSLHFAETLHSIKNLAVKIENENIRIGISGDGDLSVFSQRLFENCHMIIHDSFQLDQPFNGHATAKNVIKYAQTLPFLKILALVHIQRKERQTQKQFLQSIKKSSFQILIPEPGEVFHLSYALQHENESLHFLRL